MDVLIKDKEWLGLETKQLANMFGRIRKFFENLMVFAEIRRRICAMPVSRQQVRLMQKVIAELRRENALLTYMLSIR